MDLTLVNFIILKTAMTGEETVTMLVDTGADISIIIKKSKIKPRQRFNMYRTSTIKGVTEDITYTIATTSSYTWRTSKYAIPVVANLSISSHR